MPSDAEATMDTTNFTIGLARGAARGEQRTKPAVVCSTMSRVFPSPSPPASTFGTTLYAGFLLAVLGGAGAFVYAATQPTRLENPGLAAYHPPSAVVLYPLPSAYKTPPEPVEEAQGPPVPAQQVAAATPAAASEPARKKSKQHVARREPRQQDYAAARSAYARAAYAQYDYGSYRPW
jgi:hypothetical protein